MLVGKLAVLGVVGGVFGAGGVCCWRNNSVVKPLYLLAPSNQYFTVFVNHNTHSGNYLIVA